MLSPTTIYRSKLTVVFAFFSALVTFFAIESKFTPLFWVSFAFGWVAICYATNGNIARKRDGVIPFVMRIILAPYLMLLYLVWWLQGKINDEAAFHRIVPLDIYLGRFPTQVPKDVTLLVDLTSEFNTPTGEFEVISMPALDAVGPRVDEIEVIVNKIKSNSGMIYLHCASGHGRSGLVAAATLISQGIVDTPDAAISYLRKIRPGVGLSAAQKRTLNKWQSQREMIVVSTTTIPD